MRFYFIGQQLFLRGIELRHMTFTHGFTPVRIWKMLVMRKTRNHMPMYMRGFVAQAREVNFIGLYHFTHCGFNRKHHLHHLCPRNWG